VQRATHRSLNGSKCRYPAVAKRADYNSQLVVTGQQAIVGAMLSQHPVDRTLLYPLLGECRG
jgi:hypothetical protein